MGKIQSNFISVLKIWNDYLNDEQGRKIFNQFNIVEIMTNYCLSGAPKPVFGHTLERIEYTTFIILIRDLIKTDEIKLLRAIGFIKSEFDEYINNLRISIEQDKIGNTIGKLRTDYIQNQNNEVDLQRYNELLAKELEEQKKSNSESVYIPPLDITDTGDLTEEINQLKLDNQKLTEQLNEAKQEIEKLTKQVPILLGHHRHDDLLLLAIKTRNDIWGKYTDEDPNYKPLSSTQIKNKIKRNNPHLSDRELSSIELVACPLKRGN